MKPLNLTSNKPYLLRALCEWITDNNMTPYIVADVRAKNTKVPLQHAQDNQITLDISHTAVVNLQISNKYLTFLASFGGTQMQVVIPIEAILAIFPQEKGPEIGMIFSMEEFERFLQTTDNINNNNELQIFEHNNPIITKEPNKTSFHNPHLKIIK